MARDLLAMLVDEIATAVARKLNGKGKKPRKKWPRCPVKGCRNPFAPRFHGLCAKHRGVKLKKKAA